MKIFKCIGGEITLPAKNLILVSREDGGNMIVNPPREVWERSELTVTELTNWSFLVAATGKAMLDVLPQLEGGCINYWEAGNWALNEQAQPVGPKAAKEYRKVHLHLLGRSITATNPDLKWGESPRFPDFADRFEWSTGNKRLNGDECLKIVRHVGALLSDVYGFLPGQIERTIVCRGCSYPTPLTEASDDAMCNECRQ